MDINARNRLFQEENKFKDDVYRGMEEQERAAADRSAEKGEELSRGAYEEQDSFVPHREYGAANRAWNTISKMVKNLYPKPYFAHLEIKTSDCSDSEHYFLSDVPTLNEHFSIGYDKHIVPFKKDKNRPMLEKLMLCYQSRGREDQSYKNLRGDVISITPVKICDDEIKNRVLVSTSQYFPELMAGAQTLIDADELLEQKLQDNRADPRLQNIIATLQREQFEIIASDSTASFVVQGCAGSGKSQCMLHRLFYLRGELSDGGWEHVLLLTPTKLFRLFSADLMRRYQISNISSCSISEFYQNLLSRYDARFRNRQYEFELSEEYLPDEYLQEVYAEETIRKVESKIKQAIRSYMLTACQSLGIPVPDPVTAEQVQLVLTQLKNEIAVANSRDSSLRKDPEYDRKRLDYEALQKRIGNLQKSLDRLMSEMDEMEEDELTLKTCVEKSEQTQKELEEWKKQREEKLRSAKEELNALRFRMEAEHVAPEIPFLYARQLYLVKDFFSGAVYQSDEEYLVFLQEKVRSAAAELTAITGKNTAEQTLAQYQKRRERIEERKGVITDEIAALSAEMDTSAEWLHQRAEELEGEHSRQTLLKSAMEHSQYVLGRLESTIFEREIWDTLLPMKERYHVQSLHVEQLDEKRQRETRILYKSDLLFYLKIYAELHPNAELPDYRMFCIDEGQDLHWADYDLLHRLYPKAVFNVFGDTQQVLHTACGVRDWAEDTQIRNVYYLRCNYRNPAAIAYFCNEMFRSGMDYLGKPRKEGHPTVITSASQLSKALRNPKTTFIVRDYTAFRRLCNLSGKSESYFEYLDTKAENTSGKRSACYTVFAAKGLEFSTVCVYAERMTDNQKIVSCTRATEVLYYYDA